MKGHETVVHFVVLDPIYSSTQAMLSCDIDGCR